MALYRAAVIGAGGVGGLGGRTNSHAGGYQACKETQLVAVADLDENRLQQFGDEWGIAKEHRYTNYHNMFAEVKPDIVSVTTPNVVHAQPTIDAAKSGVKAIVCEKPMAVSVAEGRRMVETCEANGTRLVIEHSRRFQPSYQRVKNIIQSDEIGRMHTVNVGSSRPMLHNGTHMIDLAFFLAPGTPKRITGFVGDSYELGGDTPVADPSGLGLIECEENLTITFNSSARRAFAFYGIELIGEGGAIRINERLNEWCWWKRTGAGFEEQPPIDQQHPLGTDDSWFGNPILEAVACLNEGRESISSGRDGLKALEVIVAIHIAHHTNSIVAYPLPERFGKVRVPSTGR